MRGGEIGRDAIGGHHAELSGTGGEGLAPERETANREKSGNPAGEAACRHLERCRIRRMRKGCGQLGFDRADITEDWFLAGDRCATSTACGKLVLQKESVGGGEVHIESDVCLNNMVDHFGKRADFFAPHGHSFEKLSDGHFEQDPDERGFVLEVAIESTFAKIGAFGDIFDCACINAAVAEDEEGGIEQTLTGT